MIHILQGVPFQRATLFPKEHINRNTILSENKWRIRVIFSSTEV